MIALLAWSWSALADECPEIGPLRKAGQVDAVFAGTPLRTEPVLNAAGRAEHHVATVTVDTAYKGVKRGQQVQVLTRTSRLDPTLYYATALPDGRLSFLQPCMGGSSPRGEALALAIAHGVDDGRTDTRSAAREVVLEPLAGGPAVPFGGVPPGSYRVVRPATATAQRSVLGDVQIGSIPNTVRCAEGTCVATPEDPRMTGIERGDPVQRAAQTFAMAPLIVEGKVRGVERLPDGGQAIVLDFARVQGRTAETRATPLPAALVPPTATPGRGAREVLFHVPAPTEPGWQDVQPVTVGEVVLAFLVPHGDGRWRPVSPDLALWRSKALTTVDGNGHWVPGWLTASLLADLEAQAR